VPLPLPTPRPSTSADDAVDMPPEADPLDGYGETFVRAYAGQLGMQVARYDTVDQSSVKSWVMLFARAREPHRYLSVGFGRQEQPNAFGSTPRFVELLAEMVPEHHADLVKVLSALGAWLHDGERPVAERFRAFDTVRVVQPLLGIQYFILVPAGEVTLTDRTITVLRVIPMAEEEYAYVKMRGDGAARAWWYHHRGDPALARRWSSAAREPFVPE
jgi:hypothetical protein